MVRWGMAVDLDKCSGCQACVAACAAENNLPLGTPQEAEQGRIIRWLNMLPKVEGHYPYAGASLEPMMCQHCENPPCTYVCPVSATYPTDQGTVAQIYWRCIGCRYCVNACPYTVKDFNWSAPVWPGRTAAATNPDVELRDAGVTEKCTFCSHRLQRAKEEARAQGRPLGPGEYSTACVDACPARAITFGDLEDPSSAVSRLSRDPRAVKMLKELGTGPAVSYLKST